MATYATGVGITVGSTTFTATNLTLNFSDVSGESDRIDTSHLGLTTGATMTTVSRPLKGSTTGETGKEISFDYIGTTQLVGGTTGTYAITGPVAMSGNATVISSSVTLALNDIVRGSATVRVS
jgi:hypothetical protein